MPPKTEHIIASFELKRLKNICELLFVMAESKPRDLPSFKEWLGDELAITNEFSMQNAIDIMTEYQLIKQVNGRLVFHDTAIECWANVQLNSAHDNFVRIDGRLMTKGNVSELKDRLVQFVQSEQKNGQVVNESDYLTLAKMVFPADDEMTLMKLAINQQWVQLIDGKVVYADIA